MAPRISTLGLWAVIAALLSVLFVSREALIEAHADESIHYFASDAATYWSMYHDLYERLEIAESPVLFLVGSPVLFMKLVDGQLLVIQLANLALMAATLWIAMAHLPDLRSRLGFAAGALAFPYFLFGFLSLNKEVYAMCAAILYACWMVRGRRSLLLFALLVACCARYYMVVALLALVVVVPRGRPVRWKLALAMLLGISVVAPLAKALIPQYSSEDVLGEAGFTGRLFAALTDHFAYFIVYPVKYLALIPLRAYGILTGSDRSGDYMEAVVSIASLAAVAWGARALLDRKTTDPLVRRLAAMGFLAPIPIMWSEIMHWRYYSFVYFFFLFALLLDGARRRAAQRQRVSALPSRA